MPVDSLPNETTMGSSAGVCSRFALRFLILHAFTTTSNLFLAFSSYLVTVSVSDGKFAGFTFVNNDSLDLDMEGEVGSYSKNSTVAKPVTSKNTTSSMSMHVPHFIGHTWIYMLSFS